MPWQVMHYNTLSGYFYTTSSDICFCITSCFIVLYLISSSHLIKLILEDMRERARKGKGGRGGGAGSEKK
jgi:hypothetical protein